MKSTVKCIVVATALICIGLFAQHPDTSGVGWQDLMNGKDLTGWNVGDKCCDGKAASSGEKQGWVVKDGVLIRQSKSTYLWTKERFADFILDLEVNTEGNSGIFFRVDDIKNCVQTGMELQVERSGGPTQNKGFGAIYDAIAPNKEVGKQGEWQHCTLSCVDNMVSVILNGDKVVEMDLNKWDTPRQNPDGSKNKFITALKDIKREGHIGLQDHGAKVMYRNIKIKVLKKSVDRPCD